MKHFAQPVKIVFTGSGVRGTQMLGPQASPPAGQVNWCDRARVNACRRPRLRPQQWQLLKLDDVTKRVTWRSLCFRRGRFPEFYPVSFGVTDPGKATVVRIVHLFYFDTFLAKQCDEAVKIFDSIVDHEW